MEVHAVGVSLWVLLLLLLLLPATVNVEPRRSFFSCALPPSVCTRVWVGYTAMAAVRRSVSTYYLRIIHFARQGEIKKPFSLLKREGKPGENDEKSSPISEIALE